METSLHQRMKRMYADDESQIEQRIGRYIIDVIREEATEDILQMAGAGDDMEGSRRLWTNLRGRILQRLSRPDELIQNYRRVIRLARRAGNEIEEFSDGL